MTKNTCSISLVIPVYNGITTISETIQSLLLQDIEKSVSVTSITFIDDASTDNSTKIVKPFLAKLKNKFGCKTELIINESPHGLASSYNVIAKKTEDILITLHQDIVLHKDALQYLISPFTNDYVVATKHISYLPEKIWSTYNFWQKAFFDRFVEKKLPSHDGKLNAFRILALKEVSYWDEETFKTAGEDGDILRKLQEVGTFAESNATITHIHTRNPLFSWKHIVNKHAQYAEANGALLRRYGFEFPLFLVIFFRELLALLVFFSPFSLLLLIYAYLYTRNTFTFGTAKQKIGLYFLNIGLLFISLFYAVKGFITGRQR